MVSFLLIVASPHLPAIEHATTVSTHENFVEISIASVGADLANLFDNLVDGMSARVVFDIRVSEPRKRFGQVLGDRFVRQFQPSYQARWDPYDGRYLVISHDGARYRFGDEAALWQFFFLLPEYRIPWSALPPGEFFVETKVTYTPIVFVSPLAILSLLRSDGTESSEWQRVTVPSEGRP